MLIVSLGQWEWLEQKSAAAFLIGGLLFVADTAVVASNVLAGTERYMTLGQAFIGAAWAAAFVGLLGLYPNLSGRSRWLSRIGAVFAVVGGITMTVMAVASLGYFAGVLGGELGDVTAYFLPGVFLGIVLGFGSFGVATLLTTVYSRSIGLLLVLLVLTFLFNLGSGIAGFGTMATVLGVVTVLSVTMLAIGYGLRTEPEPTGRGEPTPDVTAE
jgi:hypothetical protein